MVLSNGSKAETSAYLLDKKDRLESRQKALVEEEEKKYGRKMKLYLELDRLFTRERLLREELQEIRTDYGREAGIVADLAGASSMLVKLVRIRSELILVENRKKWWLEKGNALKNRGQLKEAQREVARLKEETVVLNDLLRLENEIIPRQRQVRAVMSSPAQQEVNTRLRRILRQLLTIDKELARLQ